MPAYVCWEYHVFAIEEGTDPDKEVEKMEKELNELGRAGWNLAATMPEDGLILFKRPIEPITRYTEPTEHVVPLEARRKRSAGGRT